MSEKEKRTQATGKQGGAFAEHYELHSRLAGLFLTRRRPGEALEQGIEMLGELLPGLSLRAFIFDRKESRLVPLKKPEPGSDTGWRVGEKLFNAEAVRFLRCDGRPPLPGPWQEFIERAGGGSAAGLVPLAAEDRLLGALLVLPGSGSGPQVPTAAQIELLESACAQLALGLSRLELVERARQAGFRTRLKTLELETLQDVGVAIASHLELDELTREVLLRTVSVLNVNAAAVFLGEEDADPSAGLEAMHLADSFGMDEDKEPDKTAEGWRRMSGAVSDLVPCALNDPSLASCVPGCRKLLAVPIQFKDELLGAILVCDKESREQTEPDFDEEDIRLLTALANQAGAAVSNARLYRDVVRMNDYNRSILSSIASGVITTDRRGLVVSFNDSAVKIFSLDRERAVGRPVADIFAGAGQGELSGKLMATLESGEPYQETNLQGRATDGRTIVFNVSATPMSVMEDDERSGGMVVSVENISEGARIKETLKRYVSSNVADLVLEHGHELILGGTLCEVTVLFADIRGFTRLSEQLTPQEVVELLNSYFDLIIDVVFRYNGTVDKLVGDEIMVLFGAPFPFKDDTLRAVGCALEMIDELRSFNERRESQGQLPLEIGIGLNRGPVISGNIGSAKHMDYTVIGDSVNLASRLVDHARAGQILITGNVQSQLAGSSYESVVMEPMQFKGITRPVEVYEVLGNKA